MNKFVEYRNRETQHPSRYLSHNHDFYELYTYIRGDDTYSFVIDDLLYTLTEGDVVIIRPGVFHASFKKSAGIYERLYVRLDIPTAELLKQYDPAIYTFLHCGSCVVHPEGEDALAYRQLVKELIEGGNAYMGNYVLPQLLRVLRQLKILSRASSASEKGNPSGDLIRQIVAYINRNYATIHSVADIAGEFGYSPNHLSAVFRKQMNVSLHDFLIQKRISVAMAKLVEGMGVTECAMECGFSSPSYFINCFKKEYNYSPRAWQKEWGIKK